MANSIFDSALSGIEKIKLVRELSAIRKNLHGDLSGMAKIKLAKRIKSIRLEIGVKPASVVQKTNEPAADAFDFDPNIKVSKRKKNNKAAFDLLQKIVSGEIEKSTLTMDQKKILAGYSGTGGGLTGEDGKSGSPYEYYTPKPLADGVWGLLGDMGFSGGKVLDPSAGTGIFGATAPPNAVVDAVELDETSGKINDILNGDRGKVTVSAFEEVAASTPDGIYDSIVTNVPFGDNSVRGTHAKKDPKYQKESLDGYFILRSLEKLKAGGLAAFISSTGFVSGKKYEKLRVKSSLIAEFMGAYRLPNSVFLNTGADVTTDIIIFKKHSKEAQEEIEGRQQNAVDSLIQANVLWQPFVSGKYFKEDGKKYLIGETKQKQNRFGGMSDFVDSEKSVSDIAKILKKFPGSRIDWASLNAEEAEVIQYHEGDTLFVRGEQMVMKDGKFKKADVGESDKMMDKIHASIKDPCESLRYSYEELSSFHSHYQSRGLYQEIPQWLNNAIEEVEAGNVSAVNFDDMMTVIAVNHIFNQHSASLPFDFLGSYPDLSKRIPKAIFSGNRYKNPKISASYKVTSAFYDRKSKVYSGLWRGEPEAEVKNDLSSLQKYERLRYSMADSDGFVPIESFQHLVGEDPMEKDRWCISSDGKGVMHKDDYYFGSYAEFLAKHGGVPQKNLSEDQRRKIMAQVDAANEKLIRVNHKEISFNMKSPYVDVGRKAEFLKKYVDDGFFVERDDSGKEVIAYKESKAKKGKYESLSDEEFAEQKRNIKRLHQYLTKGTITTQTSLKDKKANPKQEKARVERLKRSINAANQQFDSWVRANSAIQGEIEKRFNNPDKLFFPEVDDSAPLNIGGINPKFNPRGHQNSAIRRYTRRMTGILGYDVGLGKTASALLTIKHIHNIGIKKKTIFVVPNATMSNWRKEVKGIFLEDSDCLFVGLNVKTNEEGEEIGSSIKSSDYQRDLMKVLEGKHSKIFMTLTAFEGIPLKDATKEAYISHVTQNDEAFDSSKEKNKTKAIKKQGKSASLVNESKSNGFPYLEDMKVDSIVIDEAHVFKNSKQIISFKGGAGLSIAAPSGRGKDAQVKCWHIRSKNKLGDGVLPLTATPITNSPLEMYSMLSLAVGEEELNARLGGIRGADDFMEAFTDVSERERTNIIGETTLSRVFEGLKNTDMLQKVLHGTANIKGREQADIEMPDQENVTVEIALDKGQKDGLMGLKQIYGIAKRVESKGSYTEEEYRIVNDYSDKTGEDFKLLSHPFNLIEKMNNLILDEDLAHKSTVYRFDDRAVAESVVAAFNKIGIKELRERPTPAQRSDAAIESVLKSTGGEEKAYIKTYIQAYIEGDRIILDSTDFQIQNRFLKIAEKKKLDMDVSVSPKIAAMLENFSKELAAPKAEGGKCKQIIFCDSLGMHNKIKMILQKKAGIPSSKIIIVNGASVTDPSDMQDIQDGFNSEGEDNKYSVVIANEKAEVGINLQVGCQAIHHLTIKWTPDSLQQRNGRAVRQLNYVKNVRVYSYDAEGTFDEYKREMVDKKADWIGELMSGKSGGKVAVSGSMSKEDGDILISSMGSKEAVRKAREAMAAKEVEEKKEAKRALVASNLDDILVQQETVKKYPEAEDYIKEQIGLAVDVANQLTRTKNRAEKISKSKTIDRKKLNAARKNSSAFQSQYDKLEELIDSSCNIYSQSKTKKTLADILNYALYANTSGVLNKEKVLESLAYSKFYVNEDSTLAIDWDIELSTAKGVIKEATEKAISTATESGIDADRVEAVISGKAITHGGKIVSVGDFVEEDGVVFVAQDPNKNSFFSVSMDGETSYAPESILLTGEIINKESPKYAETVKRVAAIDKAVMDKIGGIKAEVYRGDIHQESMYHQENTDVLAFFPEEEVLLVVEEDDLDGRISLASGKPLIRDKPVGGIMLALYEKQNGAVTRLKSGDYAIKSSQITPARPKEDILQYVIEEAIIANHKIEQADIDALRESGVGYSGSGGVYVHKIFEKVIREITSKAGKTDSDDLRDLYSDDEGLDAFREKSHNFIQGIYGDYLDFSIIEDKYAEVAYNAFFSGYGSDHIDSAFYSAEEDFKDKSNPEPEEPETETGEVVAAKPKDWVALTGDLKPIRAHIKSSAKSMDSKAWWCGQKQAASKYPNSPENSWIVQYDVYQYFLERYPSQAEKRNITIHYQDEG